MQEYKRNEQHEVSCRVNGVEKAGRATPRLLLSDFLRDSLGLTGTHVGCEHGVCGACTVLINGVSARSCLVFAVQVEGQDLQTVEGLSDTENTLSDLQHAFRRHHALQCGYCTTGILVSAEQFLHQNSEPTEEQIRDVLSGHLCRCTGYEAIVDAILDVAAERRASTAKLND